MAIDLGAITEYIKDEMVRGSTSDDDRIWRAIIDSIRYYRSHPFFFLRKTGSFTTTVGQSTYGNVADEGADKGYPDDFVAPITIYTTFSSRLSDPLPQRPIQTIREATRSTESQGLPDMYAWFSEKIVFDREAHVAFTVNLDYHADIGTPLYTYSGSAWSFFESDGSTGLTSSFSNDWFVEADDLIRYEAEIRLARRLKDDNELTRAVLGTQRSLTRLLNLSKSKTPTLQRTPREA